MVIFLFLKIKYASTFAPLINKGSLIYCWTQHSLVSSVKAPFQKAFPFITWTPWPLLPAGGFTIQRSLSGVVLQKKRIIKIKQNKIKKNHTMCHVKQRFIQWFYLNLLLLHASSWIWESLFHVKNVYWTPFKDISPTGLFLDDIQFYILSALLKATPRYKSGFNGALF